MNRIHLFSLVTILAFVAACSESPLSPDTVDPSLSRSRDHGHSGAVFVMSNAAAGNEILVFPRSADGFLDAPHAVPTAGQGTGGGLGNQGGLAFAGNGRFLYAVNAGSNEISGFRVDDGDVTPIGIWSSNGIEPISLTAHGNLLFVLNDGTDPNVSGFAIRRDGSLHALPHSTRALEGTPDAAQVGFSPDGSRLVITAKATNELVTFHVWRNGRLSHPFVQPSAGATPFGFAFDRGGTLIVSEAFGGATDASVLSSYRPDRHGWTAVSPLTATTETAACWVVVTPNGRFTYTTNAGSASVSGFAVRHNGSLHLLDDDGVTGVTGAGPIDLDVTPNGRFLYTLNGAGNSISMFSVAWDGSLTNLGEVTGLPAGADGLVAR